MEKGLVGEELRMREREYYDGYKALKLDVCNQNVPWSTPEEKREKSKKRCLDWYYRNKTSQKN